MPTKKVWPRKGEGGREEGGEVVIERRRRLSWPKRDDDPCAHAMMSSVWDRIVGVSVRKKTIDSQPPSCLPGAF